MHYISISMFLVYFFSIDFDLITKICIQKVYTLEFHDIYAYQMISFQTLINLNMTPLQTD